MPVSAENRSVSPDSAEAFLEEVRRAERRGELLLAFDLASRGLEKFPGNLALEHRAVLALARAGSTTEAARRFGEFDLGALPGEEFAALGARIAKDEALASGGEERERLAARAAASYRAIGETSGGFYPTVNAATLSLVAGQVDECRLLATEALRLARSVAPASYYSVATEAEAELLLENVGAARVAIRRAADMHDGDIGAVSTTRRQLRMVCTLRGIDPGLLSVLSGPSVVHFCGHRISAWGESGGFLADFETNVTARMDAAVKEVNPGFAYGSLAAGGDILWAEALLRNDCELHVVLPFALEQFLEISVAPAGRSWVSRFRRCLAAAATVSYATTDAYRGDDVLFRYCADIGMGLALLRARYLDANVSQLALWGRQVRGGEAGTAADVLAWMNEGHSVVILDPAGGDTTDGRAVKRPPRTRSDPSATSTTIGRRQLRAMLFADVRGYSALDDGQLTAFVIHVLAAFADVLAGHGSSVEYRNTWGDALYIVLTDVTTAAECALELQEAMARLDLEGVGLPPHLALRLSAHVGPVLPLIDPVVGSMSFRGSHVSLAARIEPVTPPDAVYVTEAFASMLELSSSTRFSCDYVGHMPTAKNYGRLRMYRLRRRRL